jgi:hypothetical protein
LFSEIREDYQELFLTRAGKISCTAVISRNASEKVRQAAEDFIELLKKMSGASPLLVCDNQPLPEGALVLIGASALTEEMGLKTPKGYPENERVLLKRDKNRLALLGNDDGDFFGTQFAVTLFFERLGCGWFGPDDLWQVVPSKPTVSVGYLDVNHTPAFISRRNNVLSHHPQVGRRWYLGGVKRVVGHCFYGLAPRDEYFPKHPEWFCQINGERDPYAVVWWQYCYSNEELTHFFAEKIIEKFDADPQLTQYSIALNDGWYEGWCECDACRAMGSNSETAIRLANRLAALVAEKYPTHKLTFLAYFPTYFPPRREMELHPNVEIMFCKESDMFLPVDKGPDNGYHLKYKFEQSNNTYPRPWKENFEEWNRKAKPASIAIWDWYCIAAAQEIWKDVFWVQGDVATRNLNYWKAQRVQYIYNDQGPLDVFFEDDKSYALRWPLWYVYARAMWDSDLTGSQILMDACQKLYGVAADYMFAFYSALGDIAAHNTAKTIGWHAPAPFELYTPACVDRLSRLMDSALRTAAEVSGNERKRLEIQGVLWEKAKEQIARSAGQTKIYGRCEDAV